MKKIPFFYFLIMLFMGAVGCNNVDNQANTQVKMVYDTVYVYDTIKADSVRFLNYQKFREEFIKRQVFKLPLERKKIGEESEEDLIDSLNVSNFLCETANACLFDIPFSVEYFYVGAIISHPKIDFLIYKKRFDYNYEEFLIMYDRTTGAKIAQLRLVFWHAGYQNNYSTAIIDTDYSVGIKSHSDLDKVSEDVFPPKSKLSRVLQTLEKYKLDSLCTKLDLLSTQSNTFIAEGRDIMEVKMLIPYPEDFQYPDSLPADIRKKYKE